MHFSFSLLSLFFNLLMFKLSYAPKFFVNESMFVIMTMSCPAVCRCPMVVLGMRMLMRRYQFVSLMILRFMESASINVNVSI